MCAGGPGSFSVAITYGHPGYACAPGYLADVTTELVLPAGVSPAVDDQHGIHGYATHRRPAATAAATSACARSSRARPSRSSSRWSPRAS